MISFMSTKMQILIDVLPSSAEATASYFLKLKADWQERLRQEKIYVTREGEREEFISFDEFLHEVGIEPVSLEDDLAKRRLAEQLVSRYDYVIQRMGYETLTLRRDKQNKKIIWRRRLCGIVLESVFDDPYPEHVNLVAVDRFDQVARVFPSSACAVVGQYEFQSYALDRLPTRPLVATNFQPTSDLVILSYRSPEGESLTVPQFIEHFTMSIMANVFALIDHGFLESEISVTVGNDGSCQIGEGEPGTQLFISPARIEDDVVRDEILRCVTEAWERMITGQLDPIAVAQAKARNRYATKRAIMRALLAPD